LAVTKSGVAIAAALGGSVAALLSGHAGLAWVFTALALFLFCFSTRLSLNWQIAIGTVLGIAAGRAVAAGWVDPAAADAMSQTGRLFIGLLKMLIAPMILLSIAHGIASMGEARELGRLGARTLALYVATMALAAGTGLLLVNWVQPGVGSELAQSDFFKEAVQGATTTRPQTGPPPFGEFMLATLRDLVSNPIAALAEGKILPIVLFSILLGVALLQIGPAAAPVIEFLGGASIAIMHIIGWFVRLAPVGIYALLGSLLATVSFRLVFENLAAFSGVVIFGTLFHAFVTLPAMAWYLGGVTPRVLLSGIQEALMVAFTTSSSTATLPVTTRCVEENLSVPRRIASFVLPLGATVNMDGTALYESVAAIFVASLYGIELGIGGQLVVFVIAIATAIGAPGIPSAGMVTMVIVLEAVGLPGEAVGLLLTIDRFLDTFRTMANVEGDAVVAVIVERQLR
jgi:Na+/H+-dicarboxylate symporter